MNLGVVVPGNSLVQHGSGVAVLIPAGVVRAGVATRLIIGRGEVTVGANQGLGKLVGSAVNVVRLESDDLGSSRLEAMEVISVRPFKRPKSGEDVLRSHIKFHESLDLGFRLVVV